MALTGTRSRAPYDPPVEAIDGSNGFDADSAVEPLGDGAYRGTITPAWFAPPGPNGGFIAAVVLRAIRAEVGDPQRVPRSLTLHYLRPPAAGEVRVEVTVERSGRTATTCSARLFQDDRLLTIALCVLGTGWVGAVDWSAPMPEAPPPEEVEEMSLPGGRPVIFDHLETRAVFGPAPFSDGDEAVTGGWLRTRRPAQMSHELLCLYADAWWPAPFGVVDRVVAAPTLDLTIHFRGQPDPDDSLCLVRFRSLASAEGTFDEEGEVWSRDGRLLVQSRQLALLRDLPG